MHILTKLSVVVLVVLVLLAVPVFVTQALVSPNYKTLLEEQVRESDILKANLQHSQVAVEQMRQARDDARKEAATAVKSSRELIASQDATIATLRVADAVRNSELQKLQENVAALQKTSEANLARTKEVEAALETARATITKQNSELIATNTMLRESQATASQLEVLAKSRVEQVRELEQQLQTLQAQVAAGATGTQTTDVAPTSPDKIVGTITAVGKNTASLNIGSAQGVQQGMKMIIYRGGQWVADIRIDEVELQQAAGVIIERRVDPVQGDKVANRLN